MSGRKQWMKSCYSSSSSYSLRHSCCSIGSSTCVNLSRLEGFQKCDFGSKGLSVAMTFSKRVLAVMQQNATESVDMANITTSTAEPAVSSRPTFGPSPQFANLDMKIGSSGGRRCRLIICQRSIRIRVLVD